MASLLVNEIFHSIQGESTLAGERTSFIRLTGCPLRCTYCDTKYSYSGGRTMQIADILGEIKTHQTRYVCVTGGEPLAHKNCLELVRALVDEKYVVSIETDGEEDVAPYSPLAKIVMDIKTPSSGEQAQKCFENLKHLKPADEIKFVLGTREDLMWAQMICQEHRLTQRFKVLFSPIFEQLSLETLAAWILENRLDVRLQTQLHKHIWDKNARGV